MLAGIPTSLKIIGLSVATMTALGMRSAPPQAPAVGSPAADFTLALLRGGQARPVRIHGEFFQGPRLPPPDQPLETGDLAKVLVFAGYAVRF